MKSKKPPCQSKLDTRFLQRRVTALEASNAALRKTIRRLRQDRLPAGQPIMGVGTDITAQKETEQALRERESLLQRLAESNVIGVITGHDTTVEYANDVYLKMLGYSRRDLRQGRVDWKRATLPEWAHVDQAITREMQQTGAGGPHEKEYVHKNGSRVPVLLGGAMISAKPFRWVCFVLDLSKQKQAEQALKGAHDELEQRVQERTAELSSANQLLRDEISLRRRAEFEVRDRERAERRLGELLKKLHEVVLELSEIESFDDLCRRAVELGRKQLGFDRLGLWFVVPTGGIQGSFGTDEQGRLRDEREVRMRVPPTAEVARVLNNKIRLSVQEDVPLPDHHARSVGRGTHLGAALWDGGRAIGFLGADNLIRRRPVDLAQRQVLVLYATALGHLCSRVRARESLKAGEEKYRQLFATETDAIVLADVRTRRFMDINESACSLYGYTREEFLRLDMFDIAADPAISGASVKEIIRRKKFLVPLRYHKKKDGTVFPVEISASTFGFHGTKAFCAAIRDITERVRAEEALRSVTAKLISARDEERRRLSLELHDSIGQTLVAASLRLQAAAQTPSVIEHSDLSRIVAELSGQVGGLAKEVRQVSRALYPPTLEALGLPAALRQLARDLESAEAEITVCCDSEEEIVFPHDVGIALYRIAQEAVSNAVRHGKPRRVDIQLGGSKGQLHLTILDDGKGFDPRKETGRGLGLLSMRKRADAIGADFQLTSKPGRTCVEVRVPVAQPRLRSR